MQDAIHTEDEMHTMQASSSHASCCPLCSATRRHLLLFPSPFLSTTAKRRETSNGG